MRQILGALKYMHQRDTPVVHRDLKPANILLETCDYANPVIKVGDFGFSCFYDPSLGLDTGLGTPYYKAPELLDPLVKRNYDSKVDVWAAGVVAYKLLKN